MIKVIAVDLGGVYFSEGKKIAVEKLAEENGYDKGLVLKLLRSPKSLELRKGLISDKEFWDWAQKNLPNGYSAPLIRQVWYDSYLPDIEIEKLVKKLRGIYKIIVFSENIKARVEYLDSKYHFRQNFDQEVYSYDYKMLKYYSPEKNKGFYEALIKASDCRAEEILAIDDGIDTIKMLKFLGVNAVLYKRGEAEKLKRELLKYGIKN